MRSTLRKRALNQEAKADLDVGGKSLTLWMAAGLGKQRLFVIPDRQLVIVRFAEPSADGRRFNNRDFLEPIVTAFSEE
jgi:hypothetical protein